MGGPNIQNPATQFGQPSDVANTQQQFNIQSQLGSNYNSQNPLGGLSFTQTGTGPGGTPTYTSSQYLSPAQQRLLASLQTGQTAASRGGAALVNEANYGAVPAATAIGNATTGLTGQAVAQQVAYLKPYFNWQTQQADTALRNQGFDPSSPAYQQQMMNLANQQNNTVTGFVSQIEPQMYNQAVSTYQLPLTMEQQIASWAGPNYGVAENNVQGAALQPAPYAQTVAAAQQAQSNYNTNLMQEYAAEMQGISNLAGGVLGIGLNPTAQAGIGNLFKLSDIRVKEDAVLVGQLTPDIGLYEYNYVGDDRRYIGVMADEVERVLPSAVIADDAGIKHVDYAQLGLSGPVEI
jgi:hypothetical protein